MKVTNGAAFPILVVLFFEGRFGQEYMVMPGETEDIKGPLFLRVPGGEDIYHSVNGSLTVTDRGRHDPEGNVLLVAPGRPTSVVYKMNEHGAKMIGLRAWHYKD